MRTPFQRTERDGSTERTERTDSVHQAPLFVFFVLPRLPLCERIVFMEESQVDPPRVQYARELWEQHRSREECIDLIRQKFPGTTKPTARYILNAASNSHAETPVKENSGGSWLSKVFGYGSKPREGDEQRQVAPTNVSHTALPEAVAIAVIEDTSPTPIASGARRPSVKDLAKKFETESRLKTSAQTLEITQPLAKPEKIPVREPKTVTRLGSGVMRNSIATSRLEANRVLLNPLEVNQDAEEHHFKSHPDSHTVSMLSTHAKQKQGGAHVSIPANDEVSLWFKKHELGEHEEEFRSIGFRKMKHLEYIRNGIIDWCTLINKRRIALGKEELDDFEKADLAEAFAMSDPSAARAASNVLSPIVVATSERIPETPEMVAAHMVRNGIDKAADIKDRLKKQFGLTSVKALMIANKAIKSPGDEPAPMEATTLEVPPENAPVRPLETPGMVAAVRAASPPPIMNLLECPICCGEHPPEDMITVDVCEHQVCKLCLKRYLLDPMTGLFRNKANFGKVDFDEGADFKVGFHPATKALTVSCPHHECSRPMCCSLLFFRDLFSKPPFLSTAREECMVLDTAMCWAIETSLNLVSCPLGQYEVSTEGSLVNRDLLARVCPSLMEFYEDGTLENNIELLPQEYWDATTQLSGTRDCRSVFEVFDIAPLNRITCPRDCKGCGRDFCLVCNEAWASCKCLRFNLEVDVTSKEAVLAVALPPTSKIPLRAEAASCAIEGCPVEPDSDESGFEECGSCGARCCSSCTQFEVWNKTPNLSLEDLMKIKEKGSDGATYNPSKSKICVDCYEYYLHHSWQRLCSNENAIRGFEKRTGLRKEDVEQTLFQPLQNAREHLQERIRENIDRTTQIRLAREEIVFESEKIQMAQEVFHKEFDAVVGSIGPCDPAKAAPGDRFLFRPISTYDYPKKCEREQVVTFIKTNGSAPPAHVQWDDQTTFWVYWEDLVVPGHTEQALAEMKEKDEKWSEEKTLKQLELEKFDMEHEQIENERLAKQQQLRDQGRDELQLLQITRQSMEKFESEAIRILFLPVCEPLAETEKRECFLSRQRQNDINAFEEQMKVEGDQRFHERRQQMDEELGKERSDAQDQLRDKLKEIQREREAREKEIREAEEKRIAENIKNKSLNEAYLENLNHCPKCNASYELVIDERAGGGCNLITCQNCPRRFGQASHFCHLCQTPIKHEGRAPGQIDGHKDEHFTLTDCVLFSYPDVE